VEIMTDTSPAGMRRAIEENLWQSWLGLCTAPGVEVMGSHEMIRFATGLPLPPFNAVMRARLDEWNAAGAIEQTAAYFAAKKLPWTWYVEETAKPGDFAGASDGGGPGRGGGGAVHGCGPEVAAEDMGSGGGSFDRESEPGRARR